MNMPIVYRPSILRADTKVRPYNRLRNTTSCINQNGRGRPVCRPIKAVIFDLGNVLINYDAEKAARRFSNKAGVPLEKVWKHFFTSRVEKAYTRGEITTREFYEHAKRAFSSHVDFRTFSHLWNDIFWPNKKVCLLLKKLSRHYPLYLISNTNALHFNHVRRKFPEIFAHFKKTFPSHIMGRRKPDRRIYWRVLKTIKLKPEETVFIDDMPHFIKAARKVRMNGIQFSSDGQLKTELRKLGVKI